MTTRDTLKTLIDQLPDEKLAHVEMMLNHQVNPPQLPTELVRRREQMQTAGDGYRERVLRQFQETRRPGTLGSMGGTGFMGEHEGTGFGHQGFHYWDGKALVNQTLHFLDGKQIEIMERLSIWDDKTRLSCTVELSCGGRTVRLTEEFPLSES